MSIVVYGKKPDTFKSIKSKTKEESKDSNEIVLSNRLYVPSKFVSRKMLDAFTYEIGEPCENCDCSDSAMCPVAQIEKVELFREFRDGDYIGFCRGDIGKIKKVFKKLIKKHGITDKRSKQKMKVQINFTGKLWPNQKNTVKTWLDKKYGVIKSPPRSGKTVMCAYIVCKLGYQTLILVHQDELAQQFYDTFHNNNKNKIEFTDAPYLERKKKKTIVGIARSLDDLKKNWPVTIMTYQKFIRHLPKLKKEHKNRWGTVFVDECHLASAPVWSKILNELNPRHRFGCSATPKRVDKLHIIADNTIGPVTAHGISKELKCRVFYHYTPHDVKPFTMWNTFITRLVKDYDRNVFIVDNIAKDADAGRFILATTTRVGHANELGQMLEKRGYKVKVITGKTPKRKEVLADFKVGKIQILIAIRQITQVGLDLPILDSMHILVPNMNPYALEQEAKRVCTPYTNLVRYSLKKKKKKITVKEKPQPMLHFYLDSGDKTKVQFAVKSRYDKLVDKEGYKIESISSATKNTIKKKGGWA